MLTNNDPSTEATSDMASVMARNIRVLRQRREAENRSKSTEHRMSDAVTRFTGSLAFVYIHLVLFGGWIVSNLPGVPLPKFDPSFVVLAMFASVEAIFLSTFVLISQNRMMDQANQRADLDLQVSLLAEHEITRLITLVRSVAEHHGVTVAHAQELPELERDVAPEKVLDAMEIKREESEAH